MGLRETLNKNPQIATGVTILIIVLALAYITKETFFTGTRGDEGPGKAWFTTDTTSPEAALKARFLDDATKLPPFLKDNKEAVALMLFTCDGKTEEVAYLWRYSAKQKAAMEQARAKKVPYEAAPPIGGQEALFFTPKGPPKWLTGNDATQAITGFKPRCADGIGPYQTPLNGAR